MIQIAHRFDHMVEEVSVEINEAVHAVTSNVSALQVSLSEYTESIKMNAEFYM